MKTLAVQLPDDVYIRAEQRAAEQGAVLSGEVAELIKRYGEGAEVPATVQANRVPTTPQRFHDLARQWKDATVHVSSTSDIVMHPAYQQIIGMGPEVLPLIFAELRQRPGQWFWALKAITGEDPVAPADRGKVQRMAQSWLEWAQRRGY